MLSQALEGTEEKRQMLISKGWTGRWGKGEFEKEGEREREPNLDAGAGHLWPRVPDGQYHRWWYFSEEVAFWEEDFFQAGGKRERRTLAGAYWSWQATEEQRR